MNQRKNKFNKKNPWDLSVYFNKMRIYHKFYLVELKGNLKDLKQ